MTRTVKLQAKADSSGSFKINRKESVPVPIKLKAVAFRSQGNCKGRTHQLSVALDGQVVFQGPFQDGVPVRKETDLRLKTSVAIAIVGTGFEASEELLIEATLEYGLSLFA